MPQQSKALEQGSHITELSALQCDMDELGAWCEACRACTE